MPYKRGCTAEATPDIRSLSSTGSRRRPDDL